MTKQSRRKFSAGFKAKVALEAIKNEKTLAELSQQFEVNAVTISKWKSKFLENMAVVFENAMKISQHRERRNSMSSMLRLGSLRWRMTF